jgi:hypothetical protein
MKRAEKERDKNWKPNNKIIPALKHAQKEAAKSEMLSSNFV